MHNHLNAPSSVAPSVGRRASSGAWTQPGGDRPQPPTANACPTCHSAAHLLVDSAQGARACSPLRRHAPLDRRVVLPFTPLGPDYEGVMNGWMDWIENITASQPYMVAVGNHESECHSPRCLASSKTRNALRNFSA